MISTILSYDIEIFNCTIPMWRLNMLFGPCIMTLCYHIWLLCFYNVLICHCTLAFGCYTLLFCHCILVFFNFDIGNSSFSVVICHFHSVRLWCFFKVTCSSAWHSETSFGQDKLFPAKIVIMSISFLSVALSWLETWRLFVKEWWIYNC